MNHVRSSTVAAVVVDLRDAAGRSTSGTVRALRAASPALPVLARCRLAEHDCRALLDFARAGGTDVLVDESACVTLLALLDRGGPPTPNRTLVARIVAAGVPARFAPLLELTFAHLDDPDPITRAAETLGVGRRALERRLARASLPPPRTLQSWCRLLAAADRLRGDAMAIERIALDVGFPSANALRNALQRHASITPSALRSDDGLQTLVERLCAHAHPAPTSRLVAERSEMPDDACDVRVALHARARLTESLVHALVQALVFARREGRRATCASSARSDVNVSPRSTRRTSATLRRSVQRDTHHDGRAT